MVRNKTCMFPTVLFQNILNNNYYPIIFKISVGILPLFFQGNNTVRNLRQGVVEYVYFIHHFDILRHIPKNSSQEHISK